MRINKVLERRRLGCLALVFLLLSTVLWGCNLDIGGKKEKTSKKIGGYAEKSVIMPKGVTDKTEGPFGFSKDKDGKLVFYTVVVNEKINEQILKRYPVLEDGSIGEANLSVKLTELADKGWISAVHNGKDGEIYILFNEVKHVDGIPRLFRVKGEHLEEIIIPELTEIKESGFHEMVDDFIVLDNGIVIIQSMQSFVYTAYHMDTGNFAYEIRVNTGSSIDANDLGIFAVNFDGDKVIQYDKDTGNKIAEIPIKSEKNIKNEHFSITVNDNTIFIITNSGIYSNVIGGNITTCLYDGQNGALSETDIHSFESISTDGINFYVKTRQNGDSNFLCYQYDENLCIDTTNELTIYSLEEDTIIQRAVTVMKKKYPDVTINYQVAWDKNGTLTKADCIKKLNTEILANNRIDLFVCDGLPMNEYLSKGIFADISDVIEKFMKDNSYYQNVTDNYKMDGKYYMMPMKFAPCIWIGKEDAVKAAANLKDSIAYKEQCEDGSFYGDNIKDIYFFQMLYELFYETFIEEDGTLNEEKAVEFLNDLKKLYEKEANPDEEDNYKDFVEINTTVGLFVSKCKLVYGELHGVTNMLLFNQMMEKKELTAKAAGNKFVPYDIIAMNSKSKHKEVAKQFIEILLSREVQQDRVGTGVPINREACEQGWCDGKLYNAYVGYSIDGKDEPLAEFCEPVEPRIMEKFEEIINKASVPVEYDETAFTVLREGIGKFLNGEIGAEELVEDANRKAVIKVKE